MLPSPSFGAEGVQYGKSESYYATTSGDTETNNLLVRGSLAVNGPSTLRGQIYVGDSGIPGGAIRGVNAGGFVAPNFPLGIATQGPSQFGSSTQATQSGLQVFGNINVLPSAGGGGVLTSSFIQTNDLASTGPVTTGNAAVPGGGFVGSNGTNLVRPNFPLGLLALAPTVISSVLSASTYEGLNSTPAQFPLSIDLPFVPPSGRPGELLTLNFGSCYMGFGSRTTEPNGGVIFPFPSSLDGLIDNFVGFGIPQSGINVTVQFDQASGTSRLVCISPVTGLPAAGITVYAIFFALPI